MACKKLEIMQKELKNIIENQNATSQDYENFFKKHDVKYSQNTLVKNFAQCGTANAAIGSNKAIIPEGCSEAAQKLCLSVDSKGKGSPKYDECWKAYRPKMSNIDQSNINKITSNCMVSSLLKDTALESNKQLGLVLQMTLGKQIIDCDETRSNSFSQSLASDNKIVTMNDCINQNISNQKNVIEACYTSDVAQSNISQIISDCRIKSGDVPLEDHSHTDFYKPDTIDTKQITQNKNSNIFNNYLIFIIPVCSLCCCSIIIILFILMKKK
jgi:hypothetical protein